MSGSNFYLRSKTQLLEFKSAKINQFNKMWSDDLSKKRPQDASKISLTESWEVNYWCKELGITEVKLREVVKTVGHSAAAVRKYLGK